MKNKLLIFLSLVTTLALTSCLKDTSIVGPDAPGAIKNVIEFQNPSFIESGPTSKFPMYVMSYEIVPSAQLTLEVNYAGVNAAPQDIAVKVKLDNSIVDQYNKQYENNEDYEPFEHLPTNVYSVGATDVVIKKGERTAKIVIDLKPEMFDFDHAYALGFAIESASTGTISENFGKIVLNIGAKNPWDGLYSYRTSATTSLVPNANKVDVPLITVSANRVKTNLLYTYSNMIHYIIDPATNKVTVFDVFSSSGAPNSIGVPITDPISAYDPVNKVIHVKWTAGSRSFEEWYTYTGPR